MSSPPFAAPLSLELSSSRRLLLFLVIAHFLALLFTAWLSVLWWLRLLLSCLVFASFLFYFFRDVRRQLNFSIVSATWQCDGSWLLDLRDGRVLAAELVADTFFTRSIIILNFKLTNMRGVRSIFLFSDSLSAEIWRRLCVRLKTGRE